MAEEHRRPLEVFVSHIGEESHVANFLKTLLLEAFPTGLQVFVSSDGETIQMGERWLDKISDSLGTCCAEIVICSPISIKRPWVNLELGAAWARAKIPVIPFCHSGLLRDQLPLPLSTLQAANAADPNHLKLVVQSIGKKLGRSPETTDYPSFAKRLRTWELEYTLWSKLDSAMTTFGPRFKQNVRRGEPWTWPVKERALADMRTALEMLVAVGLISYRIGDDVVTESGDGKLGFATVLHIANGARHSELINSPRYLH